MNGHKFPREFENITKDGSLRRLRIPGGWILQSRSHYMMGSSAVACSEAMIEIKDNPSEFWDLEHG